MSKTSERKKRLDRIIGNNIRTVREDHNMSYDELAELTNLTTIHLKLIERGERGATSLTLFKMRTIFGISADYLFSTSNGNLPDDYADYEDKNLALAETRLKIAKLIEDLNTQETEFFISMIKTVPSLRPKLKKS